MTITEVAQAIEIETHSRTWAEATPALRVLVIEGLIDLLTAPQVNEAANKVVKQRKPRKAKTVPLTQHATGSQEVE